MKQISEEELEKILKNWKFLDKNPDSDSEDENYYDSMKMKIRNLISINSINLDYS